MRRTLLDISGFCVSRGRLQLKKSCVRISCRQPYRAPPSETTFVEIQRQTGCQATDCHRDLQSLESTVGSFGQLIRHDIIGSPVDPCSRNQREDACNEKDRHRTVAPDRTEPGEKNDKNRGKKGGTEEPQPASSNL